LVDHDLAFLIWLGEMLGRAGYLVLPASGLEEAARHDVQLDVDIVLGIASAAILRSAAVGQLSRFRNRWIAAIDPFESFSPDPETFQNLGIAAALRKPERLDASREWKWLRVIRVADRICQLQKSDLAADIRTVTDGAAQLLAEGRVIEADAFAERAEELIETSPEIAQAGAAEQSLVTRTETLRSGAQDLLERVNALDAASAQQADEIAILRRSVDGAIGRLNRQVEYLHSIGGRQLQQWEVLMEVVRTLNKL